MVSKKTLVQIVIPYHGQYEKVRKCITSIIEKTTDWYQILLVDDGSTNSDFGESLRTSDLVKKGWLNKVIRSDNCQGFGGAVNKGIEASEHPFICVMHSDCEVVNTSWLTQMRKTLYDLKPQNVKFVSATTNDLGFGLVNENLLRIPTEEREDIILETPSPMICCLFHKDLFKYIGPLKEYPYGFHEDEELFWRMNKSGFKQAVCGSAYIRHEGAATIYSLWKTNPEIQKIMQENKQLLLKDFKV